MSVLFTLTSSKAKIGIVVFLLCVASFLIGYKVAPDNSTAPRNDYSELKEIIDNLEEGDSVVITTEEMKSEGSYESSGEGVAAKSDKHYLRVLSWFGLGATEAAAKDQGITNDGDETSIGQMKGYGWAEQLWTRIKSFFWTISFSILILIILTFVPVVGPFAAIILRALASLIPILGSVVEKLFSWFKAEKPLRQTVKGVQAYRDELAEEEKRRFTAHLTSAQDEGIQKLIKNIKKKI